MCVHLEPLKNQWKIPRTLGALGGGLSKAPPKAAGPKEVGEPRGVKKGGSLQKLEGVEGSHVLCFFEHSHNKKVKGKFG